MKLTNLAFIAALCFLSPIFAEMPELLKGCKERPDSFFCRDLKKLEATAAPTHLILSGYLRKSMTFTIYAQTMSRFEIEGEFLPYELPLKDGLVDREELQDFLDVFRSNPFLETLIVSDPYKQIVVDYLDELAAAAFPIKTVNLIYKDEGRLIGDNIDGSAFLLGAQEEIGFEYEGRSMLFFGCGGVSSAVAFQLASKLKKIGLVEIDEEKQQKLAALLKEFYPSLEIIIFERKGPLDFSSFDIFYNGTGLGKFSQNPSALFRTPLVEGDVFPENGLAIDANYTPWETQFLQQMSERGFQTLNGFSHMLASTALHLSRISNEPIDCSMILKTAR